MTSPTPSPATSPSSKIPLRVDLGSNPASSRRLLVPVDPSCTVAQLARSVEERERKRQKSIGEEVPPLVVAEIQLRVDGSLCEVDPDDVISDLVSNDGQTTTVFVAICRGHQQATWASQVPQAAPPSMETKLEGSVPHGPPHSLAAASGEGPVLSEAREPELRRVSSNSSVGNTRVEERTTGVSSPSTSIHLIDVTSRSPQSGEPGESAVAMTPPVGSSNHPAAPPSGEWVEQRIEPSPVTRGREGDAQSTHHPGVNGNSASAANSPLGTSGSSSSTRPIAAVPWRGEQRERITTSVPAVPFPGHPTTSGTSGDPSALVPATPPAPPSYSGGQMGPLSMVPIPPALATSAAKALPRSPPTGEPPVPYRRVAKRAWHTCANEQLTSTEPGAGLGSGATTPGEARQPTKAEATAAARAAAAAMAAAKVVVMGGQPPAKRSAPWKTVMSSPSAIATTPTTSSSSMPSTVVAPVPSTPASTYPPVPANTATTPVPSPSTVPAATVPSTTPSATSTTITAAAAEPGTGDTTRRPQADHRATEVAAAALAGLGGQWRPTPGENAGYPPPPPGAAESTVVNANASASNAVASQASAAESASTSPSGPTSPTPHQGQAHHAAAAPGSSPAPNSLPAATASASTTASTQSTMTTVTSSSVTTGKTVLPSAGSGERGDAQAVAGAGPPAAAVAMTVAPGGSTSSSALPPPPSSPAVVLSTAANSLPPPPPTPTPLFSPGPQTVTVANTVISGIPAHTNGFPPGVGSAVGVMAPALSPGIGVTPPPPSQATVRFQASMRQWQAAENLVLNAFMLQDCEPQERQEDAKTFFSKLAEVTGEPAGRVIALVRAAVQPAPWGSGYLVASRRQLTNLCQSSGTPGGFDCLTRYLLGGRFPREGGSIRVEAPRVRKCFSALAAQIGNHPERGPLDYHALGVGRCVYTLRRRGDGSVSGPGPMVPPPGGGPPASGGHQHTAPPPPPLPPPPPTPMPRGPEPAPVVPSVIPPVTIVTAPRTVASGVNGGSASISGQTSATLASGGTISGKAPGSVRGNGDDPGGPAPSGSGSSGPAASGSSGSTASGSSGSTASGSSGSTASGSATGGSSSSGPAASGSTSSGNASPCGPSNSGRSTTPMLPGFCGGEGVTVRAAGSSTSGAGSNGSAGGVSVSNAVPGAGPQSETVAQGIF